MHQTTKRYEEGGKAPCSEFLALNSFIPQLLSQCMEKLHIMAKRILCPTIITP